MGGCKLGVLSLPHLQQRSLGVEVLVWAGASFDGKAFSGRPAGGPESSAPAAQKH